MENFGKNNLKKSKIQTKKNRAIVSLAYSVRALLSNGKYTLQYWDSWDKTLGNKNL